MAYRDIQTASLYAENDTITEAWREWAIQRKCVHCGTYYTLLDSFGARQCRQHSQPKTVTMVNSLPVAEHGCRVRIISEQVLS